MQESHTKRAQIALRVMVKQALHSLIVHQQPWNVSFDACGLRMQLLGECKRQRHAASQRVFDAVLERRQKKRGECTRCRRSALQGRRFGRRVGECVSVASRGRGTPV